MCMYDKTLQKCNYPYGYLKAPLCLTQCVQLKIDNIQQKKVTYAPPPFIQLEFKMDSKRDANIQQPLNSSAEAFGPWQLEMPGSPLPFKGGG